MLKQPPATSKKYTLASLYRHSLIQFRRVIALILPAGMTMGSGEIQYMAPLNQSIWEYSGSSFKCELIHPIPEYGTARFIQNAGEDLVFWINVYHHAHEKGIANLYETSPPWIHETPEMRDIRIDVIANDPPFTLNHGKSTWVLNTLERGRMARFDYLDWEENQYHMHVSLNPVNFHPPFRDFQQCRKRLFAYGYSDVRFTEVHFDTDKFTLNESARKTLERVADYAAKNPDISKVLVRGHTDSIATDQYNITLSSRRAQSVTDFFILEGVDKNMIQFSYYGESQPKRNNATEQGRTLNRRVEVELVERE